MLDFNFRVPWSLLLGHLGRRVFERAGWSDRLLYLQRTLEIVAIAGVITWMVWLPHTESA